VSFPHGLSGIEFLPFLPIERTSDLGHNIWETHDADAYWQGRATTTKLTDAKLQDWEAFMLASMYGRTAIDFVDPVFRIPAAYRDSNTLPFGFDGVGEIADLGDPLNPVALGLPVGLVLKRGDRISARSATNITCHMLVSDVVVSSNTAQALAVVPPILDNIFEAGDELVLLNPAIRINIVPNSWSAPRRAQQLTVGTFSVEEASPA
jgi:hypothetical protein